MTGPEIECPECDGLGRVRGNVHCRACDGEGWRQMTADEEAEYAERQAEDASSEAPVSLDEQHRAAWEQKQELRS